MNYYQHGDTGRTCATTNELRGDWYEITKEQYEACEKVTTDRVVLKREGFQDLVIRKRDSGWQVLEYTDHYGGERWSKNIDETKYDVEAHIKQYGNLPE